MESHIINFDYNIAWQPCSAKPETNVQKNNQKSGRQNKNNEIQGWEFELTMLALWNWVFLRPSSLHSNKTLKLSWRQMRLTKRDSWSWKRYLTYVAKNEPNFLISESYGMIMFVENQAQVQKGVYEGGVGSKDWLGKNGGRKKLRTDKRGFEQKSIKAKLDDDGLFRLHWLSLFTFILNQIRIFLLSFSWERERFNGGGGEEGKRRVGWVFRKAVWLWISAL